MPGGRGSAGMQGAQAGRYAAGGTRAQPGTSAAARTSAPALAARIDRFLRHIAVERGLAGNTVAAYRRDLERYATWLSARGITGLEQVGPADVSGYLAELSGSTALAASSVARMLSAVRALHRFAHEEDGLPADPAATLRPPKLARRLPKAITVEQMERLLAAPGTDGPQGLRDTALLELLYATGARISELVALDVDDLAEGAELVRVRGKGAKQRLVPVGSAARRAVSDYLVRGRPALAAAGRGSAALLLGARGARLSRQHAWLIIQAAAERAGLGAHVSPHTFRHSFATHLLAGGADVRAVQELLGHASVATTQIYTLVTVDTLRDVYVSAHPRAR